MFFGLCFELNLGVLGLICTFLAAELTSELLPVDCTAFTSFLGFEKGALQFYSMSSMKCVLPIPSFSVTVFKCQPIVCSSCARLTGSVVTKCESHA